MRFWSTPKLQYRKKTQDMIAILKHLKGSVQKADSASIYCLDSGAHVCFAARSTGMQHTHVWWHNRVVINQDGHWTGAYSACSDFGWVRIHVNTQSAWMCVIMWLECASSDLRWTTRSIPRVFKAIPHIIPMNVHTEKMLMITCMGRARCAVIQDGHACSMHISNKANEFTVLWPDPHIFRDFLVLGSTPSRNSTQCQRAWSRNRDVLMTITYAILAR